MKKNNIEYATTDLIYNKLKSESESESESEFTPGDDNQPRTLEDKIKKLNTDRYLKLKSSHGKSYGKDEFTIDEINFTLEYYDGSKELIFSCSIDKLNELLNNEGLMITKLSEAEILMRIENKTTNLIYNKLKSESESTPEDYNQPRKLKDKIEKLNTDRYLKLEFHGYLLYSWDEFIIDESNFTLQYNGSEDEKFSCSIDKLNELLENEGLMITRLSDEKILTLKKKKQ